MITLRKYETGCAYTAKILLLAEPELGKNPTTFQSLRAEYVIDPHSLLELEKKGLIHFDEMKLHHAYVRTNAKMRSDEIGRLSSSIALGIAHSMDKRKAAIEAHYPENAFLNDYQLEELDKAGFVSITPDELRRISENASFALDHVTFKISFEKDALIRWLNEYALYFAQNTLVSDSMESFSYEKMRFDVINFLEGKFVMGISPANLSISSTSVWGKDKGSLFRARLYETLLALECEGGLSILEFVDEAIRKGNRSVVTSDDIWMYPSGARVMVLGFKGVLPLNQRVTISEDGAVRYRNQTLIMSKRSGEILKIMSQKDVGESISWDELFVEIEGWREGKIPNPKQKQQQIWDAVKHINEQFRKKCDADFDILKWEHLSVIRL